MGFGILICNPKRGLTRFAVANQVSYGGRRKAPLGERGGTFSNRVMRARACVESPNLENRTTNRYSGRKDGCTIRVPSRLTNCSPAFDTQIVNASGREFDPYESHIFIADCHCRYVID